MPKMFGQVVRSLIHHPRFAIAALLVVALGSALATVVFSVLDAVILKPLLCRCHDDFALEFGSYFSNTVAI